MPPSEVSPKIARSRTAVVASAVAIVIGAAETIVGAFFWVTTATSTSEDPLIGVGYVFAVMIGVPGVLGILLGGLSWRLASRALGVGLGIVALVVTTAHLWYVVLLFAPSL